MNNGIMMYKALRSGVVPGRIVVAIIAIFMNILGAFSDTFVHASTLPSKIDMANGGETLRIKGASSGELLGSTHVGIAAGDVNGDGYNDLILGAPKANGLAAGAQAGAVYVIYGSPFMTGAVDLKLNTVGMTILGENAADNLGTTVTTGDINGDGIDDILIGAPFNDNPSDIILDNHGAVYVIYGAATLPAVIDLATTPSDITIRGEDPFGEMGVSLVTGDFNSDGVGDVLTGASRANKPGSSGQHGRSYVIYGSTAFPAQHVIDLRKKAADIRIVGAASADLSGWAVAAGDFNGDGLDDMIIGAPFAKNPSGGSDQEGGVFVIYGSATLPPANDIDLAIIPADLSIYGDKISDNAGISVSSGDINGDGFDDLLIGASKADPFSDSVDDHGAVYLIYGVSTLPLYYAIDLPSGAATVIQGKNAGDSLGKSVAAGDINGDGKDELILGASGSDSNGSNAGEAYILYGGTSLATTINLATATANVTLLGDDLNDNAGTTVASLGDVNKDGFADVGIGAPMADPNGESSGEVYMIMGNGTATNAVRTESSREGNAPASNFGSAIRATIDYVDGMQSKTTVTIRRDNNGITNLSDSGSLGDVADVVWEIASDRSDFTQAVVVLRYLDTEIAGLDESSLELYQAPSLTGPWSLVGNQSIDSARNKIAGTITSFSYFGLKGDITTTPPGSSPTPFVVGTPQGGTSGGGAVGWPGLVFAFLAVIFNRFARWYGAAPLANNYRSAVIRPQL